jgi:multidrug efflux system membrane fusion protein
MRLTILLVSLLYILTACGGDRQEQTLERPTVTGVTVASAKKDVVAGFYKTSGTVKADTISIISSKVMGAVTAIKVKIGDSVKKGDVLLTIDNADVKARVRAAEAAYQAALNGRKMAEENFKLADSTYQRFSKLYEDRALTTQEMNEIETKRNVAELQLKQAAAMLKQSNEGLNEAKVFLSYTRITSPIDGIVSEKKIDVGTMAAPGMHLMTIEDPSSHVIDVSVDERLFASIRKGMVTDITIDSLGLTIKGTVEEISQTIDPLSRTFLVKISVKNDALRSGFFANVYIPEGTHEAILVPADAIVKRGQLEGLYVVNDHRIINYRIVKTGIGRDGMVEVLSGLKGNERVIVSGVHLAKDGGVVEETDVTARERAQ